MLVTSYFIDDKITKLSEGRAPLIRLIRTLSTIYKPIAKIRLKHGITWGLVEYRLFRLATKLALFFQHNTKHKQAILGPGTGKQS